MAAMFADGHQKVLPIDAGTGFYRITRYALGDFFGPVDPGLHHKEIHESLREL